MKRASAAAEKGKEEGEEKPLEPPARRSRTSASPSSRARIGDNSISNSISNDSNTSSTSSNFFSSSISAAATSSMEIHGSSSSSVSQVQSGRSIVENAPTSISALSVGSSDLSQGNVAFVLPFKVQKIIELAASAAQNEALITPVKSDIEYFELLEAMYLVKIKEHNLCEYAPSRIFDCRMKKTFANITDQGLLDGLKLAKVLQEIYGQMDAYRHKRLKVTTGLKPRLERLLSKLGKAENDVERQIFEYLFMLYSSDTIGNEIYRPNFIPGGYGVGGGKGSPFHVSRMFNCDIVAIYRMFSLVDPWIKENIFSSVSNPRDDIMFSSEGNCLALIGIPLSSTQFLSIQSQVVQRIVGEEPGFKDSPAGRCNDLGERQSSGSISNNATSSSSSSMARSATAIIGGEGGFKNIEALYSTLKNAEKVHVSPDNALELAFSEQHPNSSSSLSASASASNFKEGTSLLATTFDDSFKEESNDASIINGIASSLNSLGGGSLNDTLTNIGGDDIDLTEYKNDLSYLQDQMLLTNCVSKISKLSRSLEDVEELGDEEGGGGDPFNHHSEMYDPASGRMLEKEQVVQKKTNSLRKLKQKERILRGKIARRLALTSSCQSGWYPRLEKLVLALGLSAFEKFVIMYLIGTVISPKPAMRRYGGSEKKCKCSVNDLLQSFCNSLEEQMSFRKFFYKTSILVKEGILNMMGQDFMSDLTDCEVEIDRRMLDFVVGLDTEFSEIVDGSHLYTPTVEFEDVILPEDMKTLISDTVSNFDRLKEVEKELDFDKKISYGRGMALLFYGSSGTGKTMLANAIATKLKRKVLLINFPTLGGNSAGSIIKLIFREAKIHNAVIFFDECESLFHTRDDGSRNVNMILTELERHDGLSIMATNRPSDLDEAMHRRISLALEFRKPDHILRQRIWKSLCPPKLSLGPDVDLEELALKYELTGGFIKNTWLSALSFAVARDKVKPVVIQDDLKKAASHQLRGRLSMVDFDRRIIPTRGLDSVVLPAELKEMIQDIIDFGKAQSILYGQWGFSSQHGGCKGIGALFSGPPGTGKTMAAEAIGYDLGRPIKVVNCAQLVSKWVGESAKNIQAVFDEAKAVDAILVFDEAEGLFGSRSSSDGSSGRHDDINVGVLLHHIETFPGVCVVITNLKEKIDNAFFRRFKFVLEFANPNFEERLRLWRLLIPKEAPIATNVDLNYLAKTYDFTGGNIKTAVFRAASRAALRPKIELRVITMEDLKKAADEESGKTSKKVDNCMYS